MRPSNDQEAEPGHGSILAELRVVHVRYSAVNIRQRPISMTSVASIDGHAEMQAYLGLAMGDPAAHDTCSMVLRGFEVFGVCVARCDCRSPAYPFSRVENGL